MSNRTVLIDFLNYCQNKRKVPILDEDNTKLVDNFLRTYYPTETVDIRKEAQKVIYKCKQRCYGKDTCATNIEEGDFGTWKDWENVLVKFTKKY